MAETAYYLAIDLGASGGRHILGHIHEGRLVLEEVHRFPNAPAARDGSLVWDIEGLFKEILGGLKKCKALGKIPRSLGIDTWGVDYVLTGKDGQAREPAYSYRDSRAEAFVNTPLAFGELYRRTGMARQPFNTVYQLLADKAAGRLAGAEDFLMLPEYFSRRLAGNRGGKGASEYTAASTTGLLDAASRTWAWDCIRDLGLPVELFKPPTQPPYPAGWVDPALAAEIGFCPQIIMTAGHDTASAVAVLDEEALYISSGTWSLLGIQSREPILTEVAERAGYTNEGGLGGKIRFLKNIMGLWVLQRVRHELGGAYSFAELETMAREAGAAGPDPIDLNLPQFLNPPSMTAAIRARCEHSGQGAPESPGELASLVYRSLAWSYKTAIDDLEKIAGKRYPSLSIIGGGSRDGFLNALTAGYTGKRVYAGPAEASALGNLLLQMRYHGEPALKDGFAALVRASFAIREYQEDENVR
jgi:rhamnulokinase